MSALANLQRIDRRVLYVLLAAVIIFALVNPIGLPIKVNSETQAAYDFIQTLPAGSTVVLMLDYGASSMPELQTAALAMGRQLFKNGDKVIGASMWPEGNNMLPLFWAQMQKEFPNLQYGVDFVNIGYKPGGQVWAEKMTSSVIDACVGVDATGKPLESFPIMQNFKTSADAALWIDLATGNPGIEELIKTVGSKGTPIIGGVTAVSAANQLPLFQSGQLKGLIMGMRGSAEYEELTKVPGNATSGMDAQSLAHVLLVLFIVLGNIGYFASKKNADAR